MAADYERLCRVILEIPGGRCPSGRESAHCERIRGPGTIAEMLFIPEVRSGHQRMVVASCLVTRSGPYRPAGFRSRHTGVRGPRHDQQPGLVVDGSTGGAQGGLADPEVVTAQEQVNRVRAAGGRRHHHCDHRPCRTAARPRGNVQRHGSLQGDGELLARGGRPVRPPSLHVFTVRPAWMRRQGRCSRAVRPWVLLGCGFWPGPAWHEPERMAAPHHDQHLHHRVPEEASRAAARGRRRHRRPARGTACDASVRAPPLPSLLSAAFITTPICSAGLHGCSC